MLRLKTILIFLIFIFLAVGLGFFITDNAEAAERHVGSGQTYSTIQAAVNAAASGDTIYIHGGTYNEMVDFSSKNNLIVTRYGIDNVIITGGSNGRVIRFLGGNNNITLSYLNFNASASVQFIIAFGNGNSSGITIDHCAFTGGSGTEKWIYQDNSSKYDYFTFTNNTCAGRATYDGPFYLASSAGLVFRDNKMDFGSLASGAGTVFFVEYMNEEAGTNYNYVERNYWYNIGSQISVAAFMFREVDGFYFRNNVIEIKSDYNNADFDALAQIRGMTDGEDSCDNFYFSNNTIISSKSSHAILFLFADTPVNVKITNNLMIGNVSNFAENLSPLNVGSGNLIENNRLTDSVVTWQNGLGSDWTVRNNYTSQSTIWNNTGNKPNPFYDLIQDLNGGAYAWNPSDDYNKDSRSSAVDVGAFEYIGVSDITPPAPPSGVTVS